MLNLSIDPLIHSFHISLRTGKASASSANHLIEGSHEKAVEFLDRLSATFNGVDKGHLRVEVRTMFRRRRGQE